MNTDGTDCPCADDVFWTPRVERLERAMGNRAVAYRELVSLARRIVAPSIAVDLICAADLRGEIIRLGRDYVVSTPTQRERRLRELEQSEPEAVGRGAIVAWWETIAEGGEE